MNGNLHLQHAGGVPHPRRGYICNDDDSYGGYHSRVIRRPFSRDQRGLQINN
jgi:hypothetical protein